MTYQMNTAEETQNYLHEAHLVDDIDSYRKIFNPLWILADVGILSLKIVCKIFQGAFILLSVMYSAIGWLFSMVLNILLMVVGLGILITGYLAYTGQSEVKFVIYSVVAIAVIGVFKLLSDSLGDILVAIGDFIGELFTDMEFESPIRYKRV